jgi:hypothetical protein
MVRGTRAGLRILTGRDFGPQPGASAADRARATAGRAWCVQRKR